MSAKGRMRGHEIVWSENLDAWLWADTLAPAAGWGGEERPCVACELTASPVGGVDPCLGVIEGISAACCGHGVEAPTFILSTGEHDIHEGVTEHGNAIAWDDSHADSWG